MKLIFMVQPLTNENNVIGNIYFGFDNFYQKQYRKFMVPTGSIVLKEHLLQRRF